SPSFRAYAEFISRTLETADSDLEATARAYAQNDCNASATANALLVDRRTVSDRLHRISQLTGLEIPSFSSKVIIYLAFRGPAARLRRVPAAVSHVGRGATRIASCRPSDLENNRF